MKEFRDEQFNQLHGFMKKMDSSDDYLMIQVSAKNPGKKGMSLCTTVTGKKGGEEEVSGREAETLLIMAMLKNAELKRLLTDAAMHCGQYEEFMKSKKS